MAKSGSAEKGETPTFDLVALVQSLQGKLPRRTGEAEYAAQDMYYDAMEARTDKEERCKLQLALGVDPTNADALRSYLRHCDLTADGEVSVLRGIVSIAERRLGKRTFKELSGEFWGFMETRPYMRARGELARVLLYANRTEEAVAEWESMLELNPNDNQGMRYYLLAAYLRLKRLEGALRLFVRYPEMKWSTVFAYGRVLERFLSDDLAGAEKALAAARKQNTHSEFYLRDLRRRPKGLPEAYSMGSPEEAACFADALQMMWERHDKARRWLAEQPAMPEKATAKRSPRPKKQGG